MQPTHYLTASVIGVLTAALGLYLFVKRRQRKEWKKVATVSAIRVYPVKSCKGIDITTAQCTNMGIRGDRQIAFVDAMNTPVTQRAYPRLALVNQELRDQGNVVELTAPGMEPLQISYQGDGGGEKIAFNLFRVTGDAQFIGEKADQWISRFLERDGIRAVRFPDGGCPRKLETDEKYGDFATPNDKVAFADKCPYLMISEESLADLNTRHNGAPFPMSRFRPNIVIKGCRPFFEDRLKYIRIGTAEFRGLYRCGRCTLTTVNPETGVKDNEEPLTTLRKFRLVSKEDDARFGNAPVFGQNLGLGVSGSISVGDAVLSLE